MPHMSFVLSRPGSTNIKSVFIIPSCSSLFVGVITRLLYTMTLMGMLIRGRPSSLDFYFIGRGITSFLVLLIRPAGTSALMTGERNTTYVITFPNRLFRPYPNASENFRAFTKYLPMTSMIRRLIRVNIGPLLSFIRTPSLSTLLNRPLRGGKHFVVATARTIGRRRRRSIGLTLRYNLLSFLGFIAFFNEFLRTKGTFFKGLLSSLPTLAFYGITANFFLRKSIIFLGLSLYQGAMWNVSAFFRFGLSFFR